MAADRAGNSLVKALRLKAGAKPVREFVGARDQDDLYRIQLSGRSSVKFQASGIRRGANLNIELFSLKGNPRSVLRRIGRLDFSSIPRRTLNRSRSRWGRSTRPGSQSETIERVLDAGAYYLRVDRRSGETRYRLNFSAVLESAPAPAPSPNPSPAPSPSPAPAPSPSPAVAAWLRQFGSTGNDYAYGVATDATGRVFVAGTTPRTTGSAATNSFLAVYDGSGDQQQFRSFNIAEVGNGSEVAFDVALDADGSYYVAGATNVVTANLVSANSDGFVAKYSSSGSLLWKQYIKTTVPVLGSNRAAGDAASGIAIAPDGSVYVTGLWKAVPVFSQGNAFIARYDGATGALVTAFGGSGQVEFGGAGADAAAKVAIDAAGDVYIAGITNATLSTDFDNPYTGGDAFVAKLNGAGTLQWQQTLGASGGSIQNYARDLAVDAAGSVYITGQTDGALPGQTSAGDRDGFLAKYVQSGASISLSWVRQFGTAALDESQAIALDASGSAYLTGETNGALFGNASLGGSDAWVARYDSAGTLLNSQQIGSARNDEAYSITVDGSGSFYIVGQTQGAIAPIGTPQGAYDAWVSQFAPF